MTHKAQKVDIRSWQVCNQIAARNMHSINDKRVCSWTILELEYIPLPGPVSKQV